MSHIATHMSLMANALKEGATFIFVDGKGDHQLRSKAVEAAQNAARQALYRAECRRRGRRFLPLQVMRPIWKAGALLPSSQSN